MSLRLPNNLDSWTSVPWQQAGHWKIATKLLDVEFRRGVIENLNYRFTTWQSTAWQISDNLRACLCMDVHKKKREIKTFKDEGKISMTRMLQRHKYILFIVLKFLSSVIKFLANHVYLKKLPFVIFFLVLFKFFILCTLR